MHILLIHQAFAAIDEPGGTRHHELARVFARQGHRVTIIASPVSYLTGKARQERIPWVQRQQDGENITILRTYTYPALHKSFFHRVLSFFSFMFSSFFVGIRVDQVDVVWGTSPPIFQGATAWLIARLKRVPFLFEVRDLWPAFAVAVGVLKNRLLISMAEWLERFLYTRADQIVVNSPGFVEHIQERGGSDIKSIPNGADPAMFDPQSRGEEFRIQHELENKFVVLYAGAHGLSNDLEILLKSAEILREVEDIAIVLVGAGKEKSNLVNMADELSLDNVHFIPPVSKSEMKNVFAAADACVALLKPIEMYKTVYPNKVFDYMAAGRPVLLGIDGVVRDVIDEAKAGIFIPPGDPEKLAEGILRLMEDPKKSKEMGARGRMIVVYQFDRNYLAIEFLRIFESLISAGPR